MPNNKELKSYILLQICLIYSWICLIFGQFTEYSAKTEYSATTEELEMRTIFGRIFGWNVLQNILPKPCFGRTLLMDHPVSIISHKYEMLKIGNIAPNSAHLRTVKVGPRTTDRGAWRRAASSSGPRLTDAQRWVFKPDSKFNGDGSRTTRKIRC